MDLDKLIRKPNKGLGEVPQYYVSHSNLYDALSKINWHSNNYCEAMEARFAVQLPPHPFSGSIDLQPHVELARDVDLFLYAAAAYAVYLDLILANADGISAGAASQCSNAVGAATEKTNWSWRSAIAVGRQVEARSSLRDARPAARTGKETLPGTCRIPAGRRQRSEIVNAPMQCERPQRRPIGHGAALLLLDGR
ncbi:hypothetical protein CBOM_07312 [Ceraceosorus bombacis]|uniref:Uncharacterized protein n=1 Tax=Ceraceosorus bombacis TaxID=401625 RepID=A0A0P1B7M8_9BASI|nr:hypothetical protein CBOM_07312 [Ceraceosorus bombacis]